MASYTVDAIRSVALVGHFDTGKTTLTEALLYRAGAMTLVDVDTGDEYPASQTLGSSSNSFRTVTLVANTTSPNVGDQVSFTISVFNAGPNTATHVQVLDQLPAGLNFVNALPSQGTYNAITGIWDIGTLPAGATVTWAGLYWGGYTTNALRSTVKIATPASSAYATYTATQLDVSGSAYQGFAEVTSLVRAAGAGVYRVADVRSTPSTS